MLKKMIKTVIKKECPTKTYYVGTVIDAGNLKHEWQKKLVGRKVIVRGIDIGKLFEHRNDKSSGQTESNEYLLGGTLPPGSIQTLEEITEHECCCCNH